MKKPTLYQGIFGNAAERSEQTVAEYGAVSVIPFERKARANEEPLNLREAFEKHNDGEVRLLEGYRQSSSGEGERPRWYDLLIIVLVGLASCGITMLGFWKLFDLIF